MMHFRHLAKIQLKNLKQHFDRGARAPLATLLLAMSFGLFVIAQVKGLLAEVTV